MKMFAPIPYQAQDFDTNDIRVVECGDELITVRSSPTVLGATL